MLLVKEVIQNIYSVEESGLWNVLEKREHGVHDSVYSVTCVTNVTKVMRVTKVI